MNLSVVLREDGRTGTAGRGARYARRALVVAQVALAFVLLIGGGSAAGQLPPAARRRSGFPGRARADRRVSPLETAYPDGRRFGRIRAARSSGSGRCRASRPPAVSSFLPFGRDNSSSVIIPEGYVMAPGESVVSPNQLYVTARLPRGAARPAASAGVTSPRATRHPRPASSSSTSGWPSGSGRTPIRSAGACTCRRARRRRQAGSQGRLAAGGRRGRIVKLAASIEGEDARAGAYYLPYAQDPSRGVGFAIRTSGAPDASVTAAVQRRRWPRSIPSCRCTTSFAMTERIERSLNPRKAPMLLSLAFGARRAAAGGNRDLWCAGLSGEPADAGDRHPHGARERSSGILRLVLREGVALLLVGLAGGMAGRHRAARRHRLAALRRRRPRHRRDPGGHRRLALAALAASLGPARRAARVDPVVALSAS